MSVKWIPVRSYFFYVFHATFVVLVVFIGLIKCKTILFEIINLKNHNVDVALACVRNFAMHCILKKKFEKKTNIFALVDEYWFTVKSFIVEQIFWVNDLNKDDKSFITFVGWIQ